MNIESLIDELHGISSNITQYTNELSEIGLDDVVDWAGDISDVATKLKAALQAMERESAHIALKKIRVDEENQRLKSILKKHHDWHLQQGNKDFGDGIVLDMAAEYCDGALYEETQEMLKDFKPQPQKD